VIVNFFPTQTIILAIKFTIGNVDLKRSISDGIDIVAILMMSMLIHLSSV
jgi:hypothetical protein